MSDQLQHDLQRRSSYIATPVLSPTDSIAFSDYLASAQQPLYEESLQDYSSNESYATQSPWHQPSEHSSQPTAQVPMAGSYHSARHSYVQIDPVEASAESDAGIHHWYPMTVTAQPSRVTSLSEMPTEMASTVPSWHQQDSRPNLDYFPSSRHSSQTGGHLKNSSNSADDTHAASLINMHQHTSQHAQDDPLHYARSSRPHYPQAQSPFHPPIASAQLGFQPTSAMSLVGEHEYSSESATTIPHQPQSAHHADTEAQVPPKRKRGRPKVNRDVQPVATKSSKSKQNRRQPHNEIERKYREGLNSEMDRLREVVPTKATIGQAGDTSSPASSTSRFNQSQQTQKPTKAAVIKSAVQEIERLKEEQTSLREALESAKRQRDEYRHEVDMLKRQPG